MMNFSRLNSIPSTVRIPLLAALVALSMASFTTACTDGSTGEPEGTPEGGEPDVGPGDDVTTLDLAEAILGIANDCDAFLVEVGFLDQFGSADELVEQLDSEAGNPNVVYNQAAANACYTFIVDGGYCDALKTGGSVSEDCERIFEGVLAEGDECDFNECAFGMECVQNGGDCGVCEKLPTEGETCNGSCSYGFVCDNGTCAEPPAPLAAGDACPVNSNRCGDLTGLACVDSVCVDVTIVGIGDTCDGIETFCAPVLTTTCTGDGPLTCQALPDIGDSCATIRNCQNGFCDNDAAVCTAFRADGEACDFGQCENGSSCDEGICTPFQDIVDDQCTE